MKASQLLVRVLAFSAEVLSSAASRRSSCGRRLRSTAERQLDRRSRATVRRAEILLPSSARCDSADSRCERTAGLIGQNPLPRLLLSRQLGWRSSSPSIRGSRQASWSTSSACSKHLGKGTCKTCPAASRAIVWNHCRRNSYRSPLGSNGLGSGVFHADAVERCFRRNEQRLVVVAAERDVRGAFGNVDRL